MERIMVTNQFYNIRYYIVCLLVMLVILGCSMVPLIPGNDTSIEATPASELVSPQEASPTAQMSDDPPISEKPTFTC